MKVKYVIIAVAIAFLATLFFGWMTGRERGITTLELEMALLKTGLKLLQFVIASGGRNK